MNDCRYEQTDEDRAILILAYLLETTTFCLTFEHWDSISSKKLSSVELEKKLKIKQAGPSFHSENFWERI